MTAPTDSYGLAQSTVDKPHWQLIMERYWRFKPADAPRCDDLYVAPHGDDGHPGTVDQPLRSLEEALSRAEDGMGIYPTTGTYNESLTITKGVEIRAADRAAVVITGEVTVAAPWVKLVGLTFDGLLRLNRDCNHLFAAQNRFADGGIVWQPPPGAEAIIQGNAFAGDGGKSAILIETNNSIANVQIRANRIRDFQIGVNVTGIEADARSTMPKLVGNEFGKGVTGFAVNGHPKKRAVSDSHVSARSTPTHWWVSPSGDDEAQGSEFAPLQTVGRALAQANPGDRIHLRGGHYAGADTLEGQGTATQPVVICPADDEPVAIHDTWTLRNCAHLQVENLTFLRSSQSALVLATNCHHNRFAGLHIFDNISPAFTILIEGPACSHNHFHHCRFVRDAAFADEEGDTANITDDVGNLYNLFSHCEIEGYRTGFHVGHGALAKTPSHFCGFLHNTLRRCSRDGIHVKTCDNLILGNRFEESRRGMMLRGGERNIIAENQFLRNHEDGLLVLGWDQEIWGNRFQNNGFAGIRSGNHGPDRCIHFRSGHGTRIRNNILVGNGREAAGAQLRLGPDTSTLFQSNIVVGLGDALLNLNPLAHLLMVDFNVFHQGQPPTLRPCEGGAHDMTCDPELSKGPGGLDVGSRDAQRTVGWHGPTPPPMALTAPWQRELLQMLEAAEVPIGRPAAMSGGGG